VAEFDILYDAGISIEGGLIDVGVELDLIKKTGAFFSYGDTRLSQGRDNARVFLKKNPQIAQDIDGQIRRETLPSHQFQPQTPAVDAPIQADGSAQPGALSTTYFRARVQSKLELGPAMAAGPRRSESTSPAVGEEVQERAQAAGRVSGGWAGNLRAACVSRDHAAFYPRGRASIPRRSVSACWPSLYRTG
jgi:hypothetical protein